MFGIFKSVTQLATDVVDIVLTPVEMLVDVATAATKPIAEVCKELKDEVKSLKD